MLLADDHRMMAEGLKALLPDEFELVGIVEDGRAMIEAAERLRPDVIVADVAMPNLNGFEALTRLRKSHPNIKVVFLTMHQNAAYARRALDAGASGFVVPGCRPSRQSKAARTFFLPGLRALGSSRRR